MPINNTQNKKGRLTGLCIQPPDDWHFWNSLLQQIEARLGLKAFRKSKGFSAQTTFNFATSAILRIARYYVLCTLYNTLDPDELDLYGRHHTRKTLF